MGKDKVKKLKQLIKQNRPSKLKIYVKKHRIDLDSVMLDKGRSFLHYTCKHGYNEVLRYMMKSVSSTCDIDGNTPLHLALTRSAKYPEQMSQLYTEIVLPLLQQDGSLLDKANNAGKTCRRLLDSLVDLQEIRSGKGKEEKSHSEEDEEDLWEQKLKEEMQEDDYQSFGHTTGAYEEDIPGETYAEWTSRINEEYYRKKHAEFRRSFPRVSNHSPEEQKKHKETDPDLEKARENMKRRYEENQKKDRENYNVYKKRRYEENCSKLFREGNDALMIRYKDVPWPFTKNVTEISTVLFCDINTGSLDYKKYLREQQRRWHPDKFIQKLGSKLHHDDRDKILETVKEVSQTLNKLSEGH